MYTIRRMPEFDAWFATISDQKTKQRLVARLRKAQLGNLGDIKALGKRLYEMREHFGPGWRLYFLKADAVLIVMLGGGNKSSQPQDIGRAMQLANQIELSEVRHEQEDQRR